MRASVVAITFAVGIGLALQTTGQTPPPLLKRWRAIIYPHGPDGVAVPVSDLFQAVMDNDFKEVDSLLRHGADPNEISPLGIPPLIEAMERKTDPHIAEVLIKYGADVNVRPIGNKMSPIFYAINRRRTDLVIMLLEHGAKVNLQDYKEKSPLDRAKEVNDQQMIKVIEAAAASTK